MGPLSPCRGRNKTLASRPENLHLPLRHDLCYTRSPLLLLRAQNDLMDLQYVGAGEHLRRRAIAVRDTERLAIGPIPEVLFALPVRLHQIIPLLSLVLPLAGLVVEAALHGAQHLVFDKTGRAVDEMGAMAEAVFKFGFVVWSNGDTVRDDE